MDSGASLTLSLTGSRSLSLYHHCFPLNIFRNIWSTQTNHSVQLYRTESTYTIAFFCSFCFVLCFHFFRCLLFYFLLRKICVYIYLQYTHLCVSVYTINIWKIIVLVIFHPFIFKIKIENLFIALLKIVGQKISLRHSWEPTKRNLFPICPPCVLSPYIFGFLNTHRQ